MNPKCDACGKTAYLVESVKIQDLVFHKKCFKCLHHHNKTWHNNNNNKRMKKQQAVNANAHST